MNGLKRIAEGLWQSVLKYTVTYLSFGCRFLQRHFTWVSVIVIWFFGCCLICFNAWRNKFKYYSWKNWKSEAAIKGFVFLIFLILIKFLIGGFFR